MNSPATVESEFREAELSGLLQSTAMDLVNNPQKEAPDAFFREMAEAASQYPGVYKSIIELLGEQNIYLLKEVQARIVAGTVKPKDPAPDSLRHKPEPQASFPVDALGKTLSGVARAIHDTIQTPLPIAAHSVMAAASLVVQGHRDIQTPHGETFPLSLFFLSILDSGERKSAADDQAIKAIRALISQQFIEHEKTMKIHLDEMDVYKKARSAVLNEKDNTGKPISLEKKKQALADLVIPIKPLSPERIVENLTIEGMYKLLQDAQPSIGLMSDEGGMFVGSHAMLPENLLKTLTTISKLFDGSALDRVRAGDGASRLTGRRMSLHLMMQGEVASKLFSQSIATSQGFLPRCLISAPASIAETRRYKNTVISELQTVKIYQEKITAIASQPLPVDQDNRQHLIPTAICMDNEAQDLWIKFHDAVQPALADEYDQIKGFANRLPEQALRLAGVIGSFETDLAMKTIDIDTMQAGIELAQWYADELLRIKNDLVVDPDIILAEKLLDFVKQRNHRNLYSVLIQQYGPTSLRQKADLDRVIKLLVSTGHLIPNPTGEVIEDKPRLKSWRLNNGL